MLPSVTTNLAGKIDKLAERFRRRHRVPAVVVGLVVAGDTVPAVKGYGSLNGDGGSVPTGTSIFEIGSVTKTFTAAALAWLVNEQRISAISDPAQRYVPDGSGGGVTIPLWQGKIPVTLLDLADFAPGFPPDSDKKDAIPSTLGYQGLFSFISNHPDLLVSQPGTTYAYADAAFELLGAILAHVQSSGNGYDYGALLGAMIAAGGWDMPDTVVQMSASQRAGSSLDTGRASSSPTPRRLAHRLDDERHAGLASLSDGTSFRPPRRPFTGDPAAAAVHQFGCPNRSGAILPAGPQPPRLHNVLEERRGRGLQQLHHFLGGSRGLGAAWGGSLRQRAGLEPGGTGQCHSQTTLGQYRAGRRRRARSARRRRLRGIMVGMVVSDDSPIILNLSVNHHTHFPRLSASCLSVGQRSCFSLTAGTLMKGRISSLRTQ